MTPIAAVMPHFVGLGSDLEAIDQKPESPPSAPLYSLSRSKYAEVKNFLDLPRELRDIIYKFMIQSSQQLG